MITRALTFQHERLEIPAQSDWLLIPEIQAVFERDILPAYLARARWYPGRNTNKISPAITAAIPFGRMDDADIWLAAFEAAQDGLVYRYLLPLRIEWGVSPRHSEPIYIAAVRQGERDGTLIDAATDWHFVSTLMQTLRSGFPIDGIQNSPQLEFLPGASFMKCSGAARRIRPIKTEQSNSTAIIDDRYVAKIYRKLEAGTSPEIEMGRFLTDIAQFRNTPALEGSVELIEGAQRTAIAVIHAFVANDGDAWSVSAACIDKFLQMQRTGDDAPDAASEEPRHVYQRHVAQIGKRVGEMHVALASRGDMQEFSPEEITRSDVGEWTDDILLRARRLSRELANMSHSLREPDRKNLQEVVARLLSINSQLEELFPPEGRGVKIRHHGDLHLGQILVAGDDIYIIDFEGEPSRSIFERRRKAPAARDVAGIIRSIDYSLMAALFRHGPGKQRERLRPILAAWREEATNTFLASYRRAIDGSSLWPDRVASDRMLNFFLLEKVIYEIEYEMSYRPDWIGVPLGGVARILRSIS
jgi:maltose alpha-D-glucosyltransferase / alpha-amylase